MREELWDLIDGIPQVDPTALAAAIEWQVGSGDLDYRTRLLISDSADALETGQTLRADTKLAANAELDWKYIFDEPLP